MITRLDQGDPSILAAFAGLLESGYRMTAEQDADGAMRLSLSKPGAVMIGRDGERTYTLSVRGSLDSIFHQAQHWLASRYVQED